MTPRWKRRDGLDEEIRTHLEMAVRDRMERGETRAEAEAAARREFGNVMVVKEVTRDLDGRVWLARLAQDLRYATRLLRRSPGFTLVAILSLALGIGAATAIFQIVDAVRLRSLPVARPSELARIRIADMSGARGNFSSPYRPVNNRVFEQIRRQQQGFTDVAAWGASGFNLADGGETRSARGLIVSGTFFDLLGRMFTANGTGLGHSYGRRLQIALAAASLLFMLLPAVNLINLNTSRILERAPEIGVRKAFGASSRTLVGQFIVENLVLTLVGAAIGAIAAAVLLAAINNSGVIPYAHLTLNYRILGWGVLLAVVFGLLSGVYPAWRMSRLHPVEALKGAAR